MAVDFSDDFGNRGQGQLVRSRVASSLRWETLHVGTVLELLRSMGGTLLDIRATLSKSSKRVRVFHAMVWREFDEVHARATQKNAENPGSLEQPDAVAWLHTSCLGRQMVICLLADLTSGRPHLLRVKLAMRLALLCVRKLD